MTNAAIQTHGLTRRFGALTAVEDVTFSVATGQFFGFLGPNGAGKSTTIKMLTGLLEPSAGTIEILGQPFSSTALDLKRQIGVVPEAWRCWAGSLRRSTCTSSAACTAWITKRRASARWSCSSSCSSRMKPASWSLIFAWHAEEVALAAAVIHGPKVLFLDEPFEGVDAIAAGMLKTMLQGMINRGATIFLTTHVLEIVERLCSHVAIISQGHLVANGSLAELRAGVASTLPGAEREQRLTLEEIFLSIVGASGQEPAQELSWLA
jgi:ABC-2 type transport system ATP-binding protein